MVDFKTLNLEKTGDGSYSIPTGVRSPDRTVNRQLKRAILMAANRAGGGLDEDETDEGLINYLTIQAHVNAPAFLGMLGKVLPMQIEAGGDGSGTITQINLVGVIPAKSEEDGDA